MIKCNKCKKIYNETDFIKSDNSFYKFCKKCRIYKKEYYAKNKDKILKQAKNSINNNTERKNRLKIYGEKYRSENKDKIKKKNKIYRDSKKDKIKEKDKIYRDSNKDKIKKKKTEYYINNKNKIIKRQIEKEALKNKNNPQFKLRRIISGSIRIFLKKQNTSKNNSSILKYLPYTIQELKEHLEKQFESWMNWNNHGVYKLNKWDDNDQSTWTWQIDHIIPQSDLPYTSMEDENFKKCWALENLRPYSSKQNLLDGVNRVRHV